LCDEIVHVIETMMKSAILVVDDEPEAVELVEFNLRQAGFDVTTAADGEEALKKAKAALPALIVLDLMLPEIDGLEVCKLLRRDPATAGIPIVMLTAKAAEIDRVLGLELGADDYITKPFGMRELVARIRAVLRRSNGDPGGGEVLRAADITLDKSSRFVKVAGQFVNLTPSEFDLLATLMASPGRAFSRHDLLMELQGTAFEGIERTIDVHVRNLRTKIEPEPGKPRYIETVFGIGYRFSVNPTVEE
jgi:two-component system alkaline phosphatase synthesis response regulator PhoP